MTVVPGGGAIARVDDEATAFGQRNAPDSTSTTCRCGRTRPTTERNIAYTKAISGAMKPWAAGGAYLNFIGDEGPTGSKPRSGPRSTAKLQALKTKWDPTNLFRHNQNIRPG